jgi:hypothetical protein
MRAPLRFLGAGALAGALAVLVAGRAAGAQRSHPAATRTASTNPLALPLGTASGEFERAVGHGGFAVGVGGFSTFGDEPTTLTDGGSDAYRSLQLKLKYYPREDGLRGFAVGLTAGVAHERQLASGAYVYDGAGRLVSRAETFRSRTAPTLGVTLDYNLFLGRRRAFLIGLGVGARRAFGGRDTGARGFGTRPLNGPLLDPRLQVGVGF